MYNGNITNSYATGNVTGNEDVGGLAGALWGRRNIITNSYAAGNVTGENSVGGLAGWLGNGIITNSYATGNVTGNENVGGLAGRCITETSPTAMRLEMLLEVGM